MAHAREGAKVTVPKSGRSRFALIGEIWSELKKVNWPSWQDLWRLTLMVLVVCVVAAIVLGLFDWGFNELIQGVFL